MTFATPYEGFFDAKDSEITVFDLETNLAHTAIWCSGWESLDGTKGMSLAAQEARESFSEAKFLVAHNGLTFDFPVAERVWAAKGSEGCTNIDSMVLAMLLKPNPGLNSFGLDTLVKQYLPGLGYAKLSIEKHEFDLGLTPKMLEYCERDVEITAKLVKELRRRLQAAKFSTLSIAVEHEVAKIINRQCEHGVLLDEAKAMMASAELHDTIGAIKTKMELEFEPNVKVLKTKTKYTPFNPGSRQQIADRLIKRGWKPTKQTPTGRPKVDEDTLGELETLGHPEALAIASFLKLSKIVGMIDKYISYADPKGRIHGKVMANGAVTGRMTHSQPNLGNIPAKDLIWGPRCRELFTVPKDFVMVGCDAKSLEERMLAHYINDPVYTEAAMGDGHSYRRDILGLPQDKEGRGVAKTWFYAFLYGAGDAKLGSILVPTAPARMQTKKGAESRALFTKAIPGLQKLLDKLTKISKVAGNVPGLDGRRIEVRSQHAMLNSLLQGAGAVVMKVALILADRKLTHLREQGKFEFILNVHDEFQAEAYKDVAEEVKQAFLDSMLEAGEFLGVRLPVEGDAHIGNNWSETH